MKLIVDIDEDVYTRLFDNGIQDNEIAIDDVCEMARALRLGTPLACVKAEIQNEAFSDRKGDIYIYVPCLFKLLDNIGKAESENE